MGGRTEVVSKPRAEGCMSMGAETLLPAGEMTRARLMLTGIVAANVLLPHHRFGRFLLYPLSFVATWAHEMGHVVATMLAGGRVNRVELYADLGGKVKLTRPKTGWAAFLSPTLGLLGPSAAGAIMIIGGAYPQGVEWILEGMGVLIVLSGLIWVRNAFGLLFSVLIGGGIIYLSTLPGRVTTFWIIQALGIRFAVESLSDFGYLFTRQAGDNQPSDTELLARHFLLPHWVWGVVIGSLSIFILVGSLYLTWGRVVIPAGVREKIGLP